MRGVYWLLAMLLVGVSACSGGVNDPMTPDGRVIFYQDDFSDANSGWDVYFGEQGSAGYADNAYVITLTTADSLLWGNANLAEPFEDVRIGVTVRNLDRVADASFGVLCYYDSESLSYYYFEAGADSYRAIVKVENGAISDFIAADRRDEEAIPANAESYQIEAICAPGRQALLVNGVEVASSDDDSLPPGDIGLFAASLETPEVAIQFDDVLVTEVESSRPAAVEGDEQTN